MLEVDAILQLYGKHLSAAVLVISILASWWDFLVIGSPFILSYHALSSLSISTTPSSFTTCLCYLNDSLTPLVFGFWVFLVSFAFTLAYVKYTPQSLPYFHPLSQGSSLIFLSCLWEYLLEKYPLSPSFFYLYIIIDWLISPHSRSRRYENGIPSFWKRKYTFEVSVFKCILHSIPLSHTQRS